MYVTVDVPVIRSPEPSFPPFDLNSFLLMSLRTLLQLYALVRFLGPLESIAYTLFYIM